MKQILKSKVIVISNSVNMNKKKRIKKPWWNDNLTYLVNDMCYAEQIWKTGKIRRCSCQNLKSNLISKRRILDRETQKVKRKYWYSLQQELLTESKSDQQSF